MFLADTLYCAFKINYDTIDPHMSNIVHNINKYLPMSKARLTQFKQETGQDIEL